MSFSAMYLNLPPPLAFNLLTSFPMNAAQPLLFSSLAGYACRNGRTHITALRFGMVDD
jgi:hypothetical protein